MVNARSKTAQVNLKTEKRTWTDEQDEHESIEIVKERQGFYLRTSEMPLTNLSHKKLAQEI